MTDEFPGGSDRPLRFGVMCNELELAAWQLHCIEKLLGVEGVEPALMIVRETTAEDQASGRPQPRRADKLLWRAYRRHVLDRSSKAAALHPLPPGFADVAVIRCEAEKVGSHAERISDPDLERIRAHDLDFILRFGFGILKGGILDVARYGVWSFHHGDPGKYRGMPPGFWEICDGDPVTGAVLQRLTERLDAGIILDAGFFKTDRASYVRSRDQLFFGGADWPARVCKDIRAGNTTALDSAPLPTDAPITREPSNEQMLHFLAQQARGWLSNQYRSLFRSQQWTVGIIDAPVQEVAGIVGQARLGPVRWLAEPPGRFLADPFAVERSGGAPGDALIMAEDYDWAAGRGRISSVEVTGEQASAPRLTLDLPVHLSYPYLFRHAGRLFCVPESNEARQVCLYALDERTLEWTEQCVLIAGRRLLDPTLFEHEGRWWLFASDEQNGPNDKLHAWHAPDLTGPWQEHSANPLKTDVRSSRPGGKPFVHAGHLYRPAQDCSETYGGAVAINRILRLTPHEFEEETVGVLRPGSHWPHRDGFHTLCGVGQRTIIDACQNRFIGQAFRKAMAKKLRLAPRA
ncbi:MAG: hypothetical protein ABR588_04945 [Sphingomicrobium sp.]